MSGIISQIKEVILYRHLLWNLAVKDIKIRYRSPMLGFLWAILIPLFTVLIYKFIFSTVLKTQIENYPFFIYLMTAIFPWTYFSSSVNDAVGCILSNRDLIKKTHFPRQIIPLSIVLANLLNFLPALIIMFLFLIFFRMQITALILLLPVILLVQTMLAIGVALIVSSLQVILRDVRYMVELLLMAWLFFSPGFYSLNMLVNLPGGLLKFYNLNPFVGLFSLYRIALLKGYAKTLPPGFNISGLSIWAAIVCVAVFFLGLAVFKKYESRFADLI